MCQCDNEKDVWKCQKVTSVLYLKNNVLFPGYRMSPNVWLVENRSTVRDVSGTAEPYTQSPTFNQSELCGMTVGHIIPLDMHRHA